MTKRIGIFGWGVVAPKSPNVAAFEENLQMPASWLTPFDGFGPSNFLVGEPDFTFGDYKEWIDERFGPRRYSQLDEKMGNMVKYAIGAFIQALGQNQGLENVLKELGTKAHVYIGTGLGDYPTHYRCVVQYEKAQKRWNRFWCGVEHHQELAAYAQADQEEKKRLIREIGAPEDPAGFSIEEDEDLYLEKRDAWFAFWIHRSDGLKRYLKELQAIEGQSVGEDIDASKVHLIRRKTLARKKLSAAYGCPTEPWNAVDATLLWNIANIPAAQISMLGKITGPTFAPIAACSGFGAALNLAVNAIRSDRALAAVIGNTDPEPHPLSVGAFYNARVLSNDGRVCKPLTGLRGTHVAGGSCIWIVGDVDYLTAKGFTPLGLEILDVALTSDADHIITPSTEGPLTAINQALEGAGVSPDEVNTWDMHATATPGDWMELQNAMERFPEMKRVSARKGTFGHGMSVCGGWELTAQHMGMVRGALYPVDLAAEEIHAKVRPYMDRLVCRETTEEKMAVAGKINMGIGGINACVICRKWED